MTWAEILMILVAYCGSGPHRDACRMERTDCVQKAVAAMPNQNNATQIVNACLMNPKSFNNLKPAPAMVKKENIHGSK